MMDAYLPKPKEEKWRGIAQRFWEKLNFPNCLRALDGKHLLSGSQFFNYKKTFSIVLLVFVDADYRFQVIQVGDFGRTDDGRVTWDMGWKLEPFMCHHICPLPSADRLSDVASTENLSDETIPWPQPRKREEDFLLSDVLDTNGG